MNKSKYFGTKEFYKSTLAVAVPIMIQNGITNFVGMLDNIMVGKVGTEEMVGTSIVNQLFLVFNLAIFGAMAGAGIFTAQYFGKKDHEGVRNTFRFKFILGILITALGITILSVWGTPLIDMFLRGEDSEVDVAMALHFGKQYLFVSFFGLLPFAIEQVYSGTLRECGDTVISMKAGIVAILVNLVLNYILIFGKLGLPKLGIVGAALATVISRYVQAGIVIWWTHNNSRKHPFISGAFKHFKIPGTLTANIIKKGTPLLVNEIMWSAGITMLNQCYSVRTVDAIAAINITGTLTNLFNVAFIALGDAIAIVVGQQLGAGEFEKAKDTDTKLIAFTGCVCMGLLVCELIAAPFFPMLFNTSEGIRHLATQFLVVAALFTPVWGLMHAIYFTIRSGGKTFITFLFDSVFLWCAVFPVAYILSRFTSVPLIPLYAIVQSVDIIKVCIGLVLVKKGIWINNIVADEQNA